MTQTWYIQWRDNRPLRGCQVTWEIFKYSFINRFFPTKKSEAKVEEFINLHQGGMSVLDYSLKYIKLSKHAPFLVPNPRDEMSYFMTIVFNDLKKNVVQI